MVYSGGFLRKPRTKMAQLENMRKQGKALKTIEESEKLEMVKVKGLD